MKGIKEKMSEEEKKQIQIVNNFIMYCRGFEEKKFTEKELFTAIEFLDELIEKQRTRIDKALKFIADNRYTDDNGCGHEWEGLDNIDELVSILKGEK